MAGDPVVSRDGPHTFGQTRDTAPSLGRDITPPPSCPNCHRLADVVDVYRKSERISEAEIAALTAEVQRLRQKYERGTP